MLEEDTCDKRSLGLTLFGGLAILVAACGGGAYAEPGGLRPAAVAAGSVDRPSTARHRSRRVDADLVEPLKVGVVTDVGQLEDKSFNQSSNEGADAAAERRGGDPRRDRHAEHLGLRGEHPDVRRRRASTSS